MLSVTVRSTGVQEKKEEGADDDMSHTARVELTHFLSVTHELTLPDKNSIYTNFKGPI